MERKHTRSLLHLALVGIVVLATAGCSILSLTRTTFPASAITDDGRGLYLDEIDAILNNSALSKDQKRQALEELGIEDDALIDALLS